MKHIPTPEQKENKLRYERKVTRLQKIDRGKTTVINFKRKKFQQN